MDYKNVWESLSRTWEDAASFVCGLTDEEKIVENGQISANFFRDVLEITPETRVLEIGCGIGRVGRELAPHCQEWVGVDISSHMIEIARDRLEGIPNARLEVLPESNLNLFKDHSFDAIYCTIVFMHLDSWDVYRYIRDTYRCLRSAGRAYFDHINLLSREGWQKFMEIVATSSPESRPAHSSRCATPQEMEKYAIEAGFSSIRVRSQDPQLVTLLVRK
jgi:ubiquinone/menaquinone biosynthesis C-methylase UbiE